MRLQSKVAVVTGGGRGIGRAISLAFARQGAHVAVLSRTLDEVEEAAGAIRSLGRPGLAFQADVSVQQEVDRVINAVVSEFGKIDILVNNAGVQAPVGPLWQNDPEVWLNTVRINLGGVFLCCRAVVPFMIQQVSGKIINLSGGGATSPRPYFSAYAASKAAIVRLTETLAHEVQHYNIQVNAIAPGAVYTKMIEQTLAAGPLVGEKALAQAQQVKNEQTPLDAATDLAVFLASEESGKLSGRLISAVWDDWRRLGETADQDIGEDLFTLRRITPVSGKE